MAATELVWTPTMLQNVSMALDVSLSRIPEESLHNTAILENWRKAREWSRAVQRMAERLDDAVRLNQIPPFPLSRQELKALEASIDRIAHARSAASPTHEGATASHVHRSARRLSWSSYALGVLLSAAALAGIVGVIVFHDEQSFWYASLTLIGPCLALLVWLFQLYHLRLHMDLLRQTHPLT